MKRIYLSLSLLLLVIIGSRAANFKFAFLLKSGGYSTDFP